MHKWAKEILECVKAKAEAIGIDNFEGQNLDDLKDWTEIAKNIACFDKDYRIVEAMDKAEDEDEIMEMIERYEDYPERRYYDNYRYKTSGRFAPKGRGSYMPRRGYDEPPYYHMMPYEMSVSDYKEHSPEYWRDMDRKTGKMYYTEPVNTENMGISDRSHTRDMREGKSGMSRRTYMETKEMHKDNTPESKQAKMKDLEKYMSELSGDVTEMIADASPEERNLLKQKLQVLVQKIQ